MRRLFPYIVLALLLAACTAGGRLRDYWKDGISVTEENYPQAEERFARFAELMAAAPPGQAAEALDDLFDKMKEDEVSYYIYSDWIESAFHNYFSPCRNPDIFGKAAERFAEDGILNIETVERLQALAAQDQLNRPGSKCTLPEGVSASGAALWLVLNLDCRTCLQSLAAMAGEHPEAEHIALCFGWGPTPEVPGWTYLKPEGMNDIFELEAAPFWFLTDADGTVQIPYSAEGEAPQFATPQAL